MLPRGTFDTRKRKTRDPKRKFAAREYFLEINRNTKISDSRSGKTYDIEEAVEIYGVIDVQLLDFTGSIFLDAKDWGIQSGINRLFTQNKESNESQLLEHKLRLIRFMRNFEHENAMMELSQILKFGEGERDKFTEFRYNCVQARILMRWRKFDEAKVVFNRIFDQLEHDFSDAEKTKLMTERKNRIINGLNVPNWDTELLDYDEVFVGYLYYQMINWINDSETISNLIVDLGELLLSAKNNDLLLDQINLHYLASQVALKLTDHSFASQHLEQALQKLETLELDNLLRIVYGDVNQSLIEIYGNEQNLVAIRQIIHKLEIKSSKDENKYMKYVLHKTKLTYHNFAKELEASFRLSKNFIDNYISENQKLEELEPTFLIIEIYGLIVKGIELNQFKSQDDVEKYLELFRDLTSKSPLNEVYEDLINIRFTMRQISVKKEAVTDRLQKLDKRFEKLLNKTRMDPFRFVQVVITKYESIVSLSKDENEMTAKLLAFASKISQDLNATPFVRMIIKNEIVLHLLNDRIEEFKEKLLKSQKKYELAEIQNILELIHGFENEEVNLTEFMSQVFLEEVKFSNFDRMTLIPTNWLIVRN